ncbi:hypothetical protein N9L47_11660 [Rhodobacteraceae bacterium]|nr:hypothetical protein [Paracoccaceae bacterium]
MKLTVNLEQNFERGCLTTGDCCYPFISFLTATKEIFAFAKAAFECMTAGWHCMVDGTGLLLKNFGDRTGLDRDIAKWTFPRLVYQHIDNTQRVFNGLQVVPFSISRFGAGNYLVGIKV